MALGSELSFGVDNFGDQKILSEADTITQVILNILLLKPGQMPGLPHIGMNIKQYIYKSEDEINTEFIKTELSRQCSSILPYVDVDSIQVLVFPYNNESILYINIPFSIMVESVSDKSLTIGLKKTSDTNKVTFNYKVSNNI